MKIASKYLITLLALLVYSLGVNSVHQDALPQAIYSSMDGTFVKPAPAAFETNHFHRLPINEKVGNSFFGNQAAPRNDFSVMSLARIIALGNQEQLKWQQYFFTSQQILLGLSIQEIIFPFHFYW